MALISKMTIYHFDQTKGQPGQKNSETMHTTINSQQIDADSDLALSVTTFAQGYCNLSDDVYGGVLIETTASLNQIITELEE